MKKGGVNLSNIHNQIHKMPAAIDSTNMWYLFETAHIILYQEIAKCEQNS